LSGGCADNILMVSAISSSLRALSVFGKKLSNTAGNVANCNTDGYKKAVTTITEDGNGLPDATLQQIDSPGALIDVAGVLTQTSNVDLSEELPQMMIAQRGYEANIKALKAQEETFESTLKILA
jgi:flagellar basal body rod protein FlgG